MVFVSTYLELPLLVSKTCLNSERFRMNYQSKKNNSLLKIHVTINVRIDRAGDITFHNWPLFLFTATIFDLLFSTRPYDNLKSQTVPKQGGISVRL